MEVVTALIWASKPQENPFLPRGNDNIQKCEQARFIVQELTSLRLYKRQVVVKQWSIL